jgi:hypothetical protein
LKQERQNVGLPEQVLQLVSHGPQMAPFATYPNVLQLCTHAPLSRSPLLQLRQMAEALSKVQLEQLVGQGSQVKLTELDTVVGEGQSGRH